MAQYRVQPGDTWASIAAAQLRNASVAAALAGANGSRADVAPVAGAVIDLVTGRVSRGETSGVVRTIRETFVVSDFTPIGGGIGQAAMDRPLPAGAIILGALHEITEGFSGDGVAHLNVSVNSGILGWPPMDPISGAPPNVAVPGTWGAGSAILSGVSPLDRDTLLDAITITSEVDFTQVVKGSVTITVYYIDTAD